MLVPRPEPRSGSSVPRTAPAGEGLCDHPGLYSYAARVSIKLIGLDNLVPLSDNRGEFTWGCLMMVNQKNRGLQRSRSLLLHSIVLCFLSLPVQAQSNS